MYRRNLGACASRAAAAPPAARAEVGIRAGIDSPRGDVDAEVKVGDGLVVGFLPCAGAPLRVALGDPAGASLVVRAVAVEAVGGG